MRTLLRTLLACLSLTTFACSAQSASDFKEGEQYKQVREVIKPPDPKRILVEEVFWYGCQHCFHFDPQIEAWKKGKAGDVDFVRVPSSLGRPEGVVHQKAFYTAEILGVSDKIHRPLFDGIHVRHQQLTSQDAIRNLFNVQVGVLPDVFDATYNGFTVDSKVRRADSLMKAYAIASVPTLVVGGRYYTNATLAGDFDGMIKVLDFLVDKVRKQRGK